ncbi:MAG: adenylate/guanylate cyclase domain-containing protein [Acidimicrobiia bacterium]|nr:adenylate/guanylate cyclase domain-containing protein [Acidimicrobiia bacterium]
MRVERAFAFVDLCGFTAYSNHEGDEAAVEVLHHLRDLIRHVTSDHGVQVGKWLGDGAMFVSDGPRELVEAVLVLQDRFDDELLLRAGAASGPTILFEGEDYVGGPVNLASRLSDAASPGTFFTTATVADARPAWAEATEVGVQRFPGFDEPIQVFCVTPTETPVVPT